MDGIVAPNTRNTTKEPTTIRASMDLTDPLGSASPFNGILVLLFVRQIAYAGSTISTIKSSIDSTENSGKYPSMSNAWGGALASEFITLSL